MKIPSIVWIILLCVIGGGFILFLSQNKETPKDISLPLDVEVYSDYNCPHCATLVPYVNTVVETYGEDLNLEKKHLPFLSETSYTYAYAAEAARLQDKFDEYNLELFKWISYQSDSTNTKFDYSEEEEALFSTDLNLETIAERYDLDLEKFNEDRESQEIKDLVSAQKSDVVKRLGGQFTPVVFIEGERYNLTTFDDLDTRVSELINSIKNNQ